MTRQWKTVTTLYLNDIKEKKISKALPSASRFDKNWRHIDKFSTQISEPISDTREPKPRVFLYENKCKHSDAEQWININIFIDIVHIDKKFYRHLCIPKFRTSNINNDKKPQEHAESSIVWPFNVGLLVGSARGLIMEVSCILIKDEGKITAAGIANAK